jgi:F-type H+-transporting ATPase subunit epsilon
MKLILEIITPTAVVLKEEVDEITIPTASGEISILPNHVDLLTKVNPGEMLIKHNNKTELFAIMGGFLEVMNNHVSILADHAVRASDIEVSKVEEAKQRAEKAMKDKVNEKDYAQLQDEVRRTALELKVARRHKTRISS